jgi:hypothetical protein
MSAAATLSLPASLIPRFGLFIACVMRTVDEAVGWRPGAERPLALLLWDYLSGVRRRLTALHARFAAGKLPAAPRPRRPVVEGAIPDRPSPERRPPAIPPGPVLLTVFRAGYYEMLQVLLDDPEMRALLAASPQARRILGPLWRKLTPDPLPPVLRLPPRPRRQPKPRQPRAKSAAGAPGLRPVVSPDGLIQWEPTPCYPAFSAPPRPSPALAARPAAPAPAPPAAAHPPDWRPPDWGRPAPPAQRTTTPPRWLGLLFQR